MLLILLLAIATVSYGQIPDYPVPAQFIIGGSDAPRSTTRHQVIIERYVLHLGEWQLRCSGSIIGHYTILTADHCVDFLAWGFSNYRIIVNDFDRQNSSEERETYNVAEIKLRSESQSKYQLYHQDVALVKTYRQLPIEYIIPLPDRNEDFTGQTCTISGWGTINGNDYPSKLQIAEDTIMPIEECRTIMTAGTSPEAEVTKKAICFGGGPDGTVSQCHGDSGGPLVCDGKLAGVVSWGDRWCRPRFPTVCMAVSKHLGWILAHYFG